jgi:hypothetical protein
MTGSIRLSGAALWPVRLVRVTEMMRTTDGWSPDSLARDQLRCQRGMMRPGVRRHSAAWERSSVWRCRAMFVMVWKLMLMAPAPVAPACGPGLVDAVGQGVLDGLAGPEHAADGDGFDGLAGQVGRGAVADRQQADD